jgi:hypothetical protein
MDHRGGWLYLHWKKPFYHQEVTIFSHSPIEKKPPVWGRISAPGSASGSEGSFSASASKMRDLRGKAIGNSCRKIIDKKWGWNMI